MPCRLADLSLALIPLAGVGACGGEARAGEAPGVLLIAIDSLRADHTSVYGYDRDTTPALAALAAEGVRFNEAFAAAPQLIPAHAALLTGCSPTLARRFLAQEYEGGDERRWSIPEEIPHLAVEFLTAGYRTAAFIDDASLSTARGFELGFQHYEVLEASEAEAWEGPSLSRVPRRFLQWLRTVPADRPWFAYLHLNALERGWKQPDPAFEGYFPPRVELSSVPPVANTDSAFFAVPRSRWRGGVRTLGQYEATYDEQLRAVDAELGRLVANLRRIGRYDATSLHVLGAYGMQLGEAGLFLTAGLYGKADLSVPWVVKLRADRGGPAGGSVSGLVSMLDVAPTLLDLEGLRVPRQMHGLVQSAALLDPGAGAAQRPFVFASCGLQEGCAVIGERYELEYLLPLGTADAGLRRSWIGERSELTLQPRLYFHDRRRPSFPFLAGTQGAAEPDEPVEYAALRTAATNWMLDMNELRRYLQGLSGVPRTSEEDLERLRSRGYLGDER